MKRPQGVTYVVTGPRTATVHSVPHATRGADGWHVLHILCGHEYSVVCRDSVVASLRRMFPRGHVFLAADMSQERRNEAFKAALIGGAS